MSKTVVGRMSCWLFVSVRRSSEEANLLHSGHVLVGSVNVIQSSSKNKQKLYAEGAGGQAGGVAGNVCSHDRTNEHVWLSWRMSDLQSVFLEVNIDFCGLWF